MILYLQLGELQVPIEIAGSREEISGHSGRSLTVLTGRATAGSDESHEQFLALLDAQPGDGVPSAAGAPAGPYSDKRWRLRQESYSHSRDDRGRVTYAYQLELRETERLVPDRLEVQVEGVQIALTPHWYEEVLSEGSLIVNCRVRVVGTSGKCFGASRSRDCRCTSRSGAPASATRRGRCGSDR